MGYFLFIVFLAVLNIGLGFAVGMNLRNRYWAASGHGPISAKSAPVASEPKAMQSTDDVISNLEQAAASDAAAALDALAGISSDADSDDGKETSPDTETADATVSVEGATSNTERSTPETVGSEQPEPSDDVAATDAAEPAQPDEPAKDDKAEQDVESAEDAAEPDQPESDPGAPRELSAREASIADFQSGVAAYQEKLTQSDNELREFCENPDASGIEATLGNLRGANEEYRDSRDRAHQTLDEIQKDQPELAGVRDDLEATISEQDLQIQTIDDLIGAFDYEDDLVEGCQEVIGETTKLIETNHALRDTLEGAMAGATREAQALEVATPDELEDSLTGSANPSGLEAFLDRWWQTDPHRHRTLSAAMFDVDRFLQINQKYGQTVGDKLIRAVGDCLQSEARGASVVTRLAGQQFLLLFGDTNTQFAIEAVERVRQTLLAMQFDLNGEEIRLTTRCAVTAVTPKDTSDSIIGRCRTTLQEASNAGGNCTFLHEGEYPTAVTPPNLSVEEKRIAI